MYLYGLGEKVCHRIIPQALAEGWLGSPCDKRMNLNSGDTCNFLPKERHEKLFPFPHAIISLLLSLSGTQHTGVLDLFCT